MESPVIGCAHCGFAPDGHLRHVCEMAVADWVWLLQPKPVATTIAARLIDRQRMTEAEAAALWKDPYSANLHAMYGYY